MQGLDINSSHPGSTYGHIGDHGGSGSGGGGGLDTNTNSIAQQKSEELKKTTKIVLDLCKSFENTS